MKIINATVIALVIVVAGVGASFAVSPTVQSYFGCSLPK